MFIIVGLGNPGSKYADTRHNVGYNSAMCLAKNYNIPIDFSKHDAMCGKGVIEGNKAIIAMPITYMNLSGVSVSKLMNYYKADRDELIVIYDDISLEPGQLRIRKKGSAGGHNGIKNIIQMLGSDEFTRIKVGVGSKPKGWDLADYVLGHFSKEEEPVMKEAFEQAANACVDIMNNGADYAMNKYNAKASGK